MKKPSTSAGKNRQHLDQQAAFSSPPDENNLWHEPLLHVLLIIFFGFVIYFKTIATPFLFDDVTYLVNNPAIKDFSYFADTHKVLGLGILADVKNNVILRPAAYFTFAVNYAMHGLDARGYHLTNLLIHIGNGLLVYLFVILTLQTPAMVTNEQGKDLSAAVKYRYLPILCAMLFICHPLQTQAVTYIIQRFSSLVALFYLAALVLYVKSRLAAKVTSRATCYLLALIASILAMNTKENAFTLPVVIAVFETMFFCETIGKRVVRLVPFLLTMAIIPLHTIYLSSLTKAVETGAIVDSLNLVNFSGASRWEYLMTQFGVITTYLRLLILPVGQNFDYDYHLQRSFFEPAVLLPLCLLMMIFSFGIYLSYRSRNRPPAEFQLYKLAAFGIFWFFITLSVESSIIPIDDLIFEHRAYLPSVGFFMALIALAAVGYNRYSAKSIFVSKVATRAMIVIVLCLSTAGIARNAIWKDSVTFWRDVAAKSPNKARAHYGLGVALAEQGAFEADGKTGGNEAIESSIAEFRKAIALKPDYMLAHIYLGKALSMLQQYDGAIAELLTAVRLNPKSPLPQVFLGELYEKQGDLVKAGDAYSQAIAVDPTHPEGYLRLGKLYADEAAFAKAIAVFEKAFQLFPDPSISSRIAELKIKAGNLNGNTTATNK